MSLRERRKKYRELDENPEKLAKALIDENDLGLKAYSNCSTNVSCDVCSFIVYHCCFVVSVILLPVGATPKASEYTRPLDCPFTMLVAVALGDNPGISMFPVRPRMFRQELQGRQGLRHRHFMDGAWEGGSTRPHPSRQSL